MSYFGSTFYGLKDALVVAEMQILKRLGFNVHVVLPYNTLVNYLRLLGLTEREDVSKQGVGLPQRRASISLASTSPTHVHVDVSPFTYRLQTPVYALYAVPTIVSAAIMLATRHLGVALPSTPGSCWWELFDADWEDIWSVAGYVMRLYRERSPDEQARVLGLVSKQKVRDWLEGKSGSSSRS